MCVYGPVYSRFTCEQIETQKNKKKKMKNRNQELIPHSLPLFIGQV